MNVKNCNLLCKNKVLVDIPFILTNTCKYVVYPVLITSMQCVFNIFGHL